MKEPAWDRDQQALSRCVIRSGGWISCILLKGLLTGWSVTHSSKRKSRKLRWNPTSPTCWVVFDHLDQRSVNLFCEGPNFRYFRSRGSRGPCHNYSTLSLWRASSHGLNDWIGLVIHIYSLLTLVQIMLVLSKLEAKCFLMGAEQQEELEGKTDQNSTATSVLGVNLL